MRKAISAITILVILLASILASVQAAPDSDIYYRYAYRHYDTSMKYKTPDGSLMELFIYHPEGEVDQFLQVTKCDLFIFIPWNCQGLAMYTEQAWYPEDSEWPALYWNNYTGILTIRTEIPYFWKTFLDQVIYTPVLGPQNGLGPLDGVRSYP